MEVISIKVDKKTKEKMHRPTNMNWTEMVRQAINEVIEREELAEKNVDPREIREGLEIAESIRRPSKEG
jgi:predicted transcriptional regulator